VGKSACKSASIIRLIKWENSGEIGDDNEIFQKHVDKRAFTGLSAMLFARVKPEDQLCEHLELVALHGTVGSAYGIEFSANSRRATIANGGGGGTCGKGFVRRTVYLFESIGIT
jgi:hypothetical protein